MDYTDLSRLERMKLVADSCCDLSEPLGERLDVVRVPFPITIDNKTYLDDGSIDIPAFIEAIKNSPQVAKTAGPSPNLFMEAVGDALEAFVVTISGKLSGTFSNAKVAAEELMLEGNRRIYVFDSKSAACGETALVDKVRSWIDEKLSFDEIIEKGESFIDNMKTFFILEDLGTLIKSGRIPKIAGNIASKLSIVPICSGDDGNIKVNEVRRGFEKAMKRLSEVVIKSLDDFSDRTLYITHINCEERALKLRDMILEQANFKGAEIVPGGGLSTTYANDGGLIVAY